MYINMVLTRIIVIAILITNVCTNQIEAGQGLSGMAFGSIANGDRSSTDLTKYRRHSPGTSARKIASRFSLDQVPHTLLKKPLARGRLSSGFGYRFSPIGAKRRQLHRGVDYAAPSGTPIYAAGDGVVTRRYISNSYGKFMEIKHANGFHTAYAHMSRYANLIYVGSRVYKGQRIGNVGNTGRSTGSHLHYELRYQGKKIDPFLGEDTSVALAD